MRNLRRRIRGNDVQRGFSTEEDTGLESDPMDPPSSSKNSTEGGEKLLSKVKLKKMTIRAVFGTAMMVLFAGIIYLGHVYICILVFCLQCFIFSELVGVRKRQAAERKMPLFRSIQWAWFLVAAFFTWSYQVCEFFGKNPERLQALSAINRFIYEKNMMISFALYTTLLIVSILSLRKGLYKYQLTQYTWTVVTICIVVFQTQAVFQIVYAGLFWFVLPTSLVICNDIMAYYCGQLLGKKLIRKRFLELSPNKTWEGFLGSAICTLVFAFWFSGRLCTHNWMTCAPTHISFAIDPLSCERAPMYRPRPLHAIVEDLNPAFARVLEIIREMAPALAVRFYKAELCSAQLHALILGLFASFVAPFGGFLSSAIKRAYGIKDFNTLIPGHGGMMDRFDCQFVMFLCTYVHSRTFCSSPLGMEAILAFAAQLSAEDQRELLRRLQAQIQL